MQSPIGDGKFGSAANTTIHDGALAYSEWEDATQRVGTYEMPWTEPQAVLPDWLGRPEAFESVDGGLQFQLDPRASFYTRCYIDEMSSEAIGLGGTHLKTQQAARALLSAPGKMGALEKALEAVTGEVTRLGAYRMRFQFTQENLTTAEENAVGAESTIRDANLAEALLDHTKHSVLAQSAQAMLAQANGNAQTVLRLLQ